MAVRHKIRANGNDRTKVMTLTARRAIIEYCKGCVGFNANEVRKCTVKLCPLFPFRTRNKPENTAEIVT